MMFDQRTADNPLVCIFCFSEWKLKLFISFFLSLRKEFRDVSICVAGMEDRV